MAGAGQPFYMPLLWPVGNFVAMISEETKVQIPKSDPYLTLTGHLTSFCASIRSFLLSLLCIYIFYNDFRYPAFGRGKQLQNSKMKKKKN